MPLNTSARSSLNTEQQQQYLAIRNIVLPLEFQLQIILQHPENHVFSFPSLVEAFIHHTHTWQAFSQQGGLLQQPASLSGTGFFWGWQNSWQICHGRRWASWTLWQLPISGSQLRGGKWQHFVRSGCSLTAHASFPGLRHKTHKGGMPVQKSAGEKAENFEQADKTLTFLVHLITELHTKTEKGFWREWLTQNISHMYMTYLYPANRQKEYRSLLQKWDLFDALPFEQSLILSSSNLVPFYTHFASHWEMLENQELVFFLMDLPFSRPNTKRSEMCQSSFSAPVTFAR